MRHQKNTVRLGRKAEHRKALLANQVCSLIEHRRIKTTLAKAKAVRPIAERMVTLGKNGSIHARRTAFATLRQKDAVKKLFDETPAGVSEENMKLKKLLNMSVNEIELSVRAANCLNNANITTVGQLAQKSEGEMLKYRNFGKKSLNEIKDKLQQLGLGLGMKFEAGMVEMPLTGVEGAGPNGAGVSA